MLNSAVKNHTFFAFPAKATVAARQIRKAEGRSPFVIWRSIQPTWKCRPLADSVDKVEIFWHQFFRANSELSIIGAGFAATRYQ